MMPWWSWLLIWLVLTAALIGMLAFFAWRLFQALIRIFDELQALVSTVDDFHLVPHQTEAVSAERLAFFSRYRHTLGSYLALHSAAAERKLQRRARRINRARIITSLGTIKREWPNVR